MYLQNFSLIKLSSPLLCSLRLIVTKTANSSLADNESKDWQNATIVHEFTALVIHGKVVDIHYQYKYLRLLIVNVAIECECADSQFGKLKEIQDRYFYYFGLRILAFPCNQFSGKVNNEMGEESWKNAKSVYDFTVKDIKGEEMSLEKYRGHPLLIVNVASECGLTATNYKELVELDEKYRESKGLRILAFPCNQFGGQEPGNADDIVCFARNKNAKFDMFEKIEVNGANAHPLWKYLKHKLPGTLGNAIKWNFTKFLIDKQGTPVKRFSPTTAPHKLMDTLEEIW